MCIFMLRMHFCIDFITRSMNKIIRPVVEITYDKLIAVYRCRNNKSKTRNILWKLSRTQAIELFKGQCHYCDVPPSSKCNAYITTKRYRIKNHERADEGWVIYNGIDRVDSSGDYEMDNVVSCCTKCNKAKNNLSKQEFENWIERMTAYAEKTWWHGKT